MALKSMRMLHQEIIKNNYLPMTARFDNFVNRMINNFKLDAEKDYTVIEVYSINKRKQRDLLINEELEKKIFNFYREEHAKCYNKKVVLKVAPQTPPADDVVKELREIKGLLKTLLQKDTLF